jgi:hypothetical protein
MESAKITRVPKIPRWNAVNFTDITHSVVEATAGGV